MMHFIWLLFFTLLLPNFCLATDALPAKNYQISENIKKKIVEKGDFFFGCNGENDKNCERVEHSGETGYLDIFTIDGTEVTSKEYSRCVERGDCAATLPLPGCNADDLTKSEHPINCITWFEAQAFCKSQGGQLPTERQWEKAARGTDARIFPWGNDQADCGKAVMRNEKNVSSCGSGSMTKPVGSLPYGDSPYGLKDMAGNVREWVLDDFIHLNIVRLNDTSTKAISRKIVKGGSFFDHASGLRSSGREGMSPTSRNPGVGFRCVYPVK